MPPAASNSKSKAFSSAIATQADDAKYKTKYKELKAKIGEVEEDNTKLQVKVLKSKKAIQRLRIERAILYDRLQTSALPTNPFELRTSPHLSSLPSTSNPSSTSVPPLTAAHMPSYTLANPAAPDLYLKELDARKLAALHSAAPFGSRPVAGVEGETNGTNGNGMLMDDA